MTIGVEENICNDKNPTDEHIRMNVVGGGENLMKELNNKLPDIKEKFLTKKS